MAQRRTGPASSTGLVRVSTRDSLVYDTEQDVVNWDSALSDESVLYRRVFHLCDARRCAVVPCGGGQRAAYFASRGLQVLALEDDNRLLASATAHALDFHDAVVRRGGSLAVERGDLADLAARLRGNVVDAVVVPSDGLTRCADLGALRAALHSLYESLAQGGVAVAVLANYCRLTYAGRRTGVPEVRDDAEGTKLFVRLASPEPDGEHVVFDYLRATKRFSALQTAERRRDRRRNEADERLKALPLIEEDVSFPAEAPRAPRELPHGDWCVEVRSERHLALPPEMAVREFELARFEVVEIAGDYRGTPFKKLEDEEMVMVLRKRSGRRPEARYGCAN